MSKHASIYELPFTRNYVTTSKTQWATDTEQKHEKLIAAAQAKFNIYKQTVEDEAKTTEVDIQIQIERAKIQKELSLLAGVWNRYTELKKSVLDMKPYLNDPDPSLRELFESEYSALCDEFDTIITSTIPSVIIPPLATASLPVIMSLNAGIGGLEAALCTEDIARMYLRFAANRGWKVEEISRVEGTGGKGGGGVREVTLKLEKGEWGEEGAEVYGALQWEKGVHRVQRIPAHESQGRIHTSTVAVIVMPIYPDTVDTPLVDPKDVKIEVMRARGAGGQHVNKTESAVRMTHVPTGISVSMQDSRSQHQNRAWAWEILRARLSEKKHTEEVEARRASRRDQVKGADRSDKIRTYNFNQASLQDRLTDHRFGFTVIGLQNILDGGGLEDVITIMKRDFNERRLEALLKGEEDLDY
nr:peptide chain release factor 1 [Cryptococcus depauperatus CBS 7855]